MIYVNSLLLLLCKLAMSDYIATCDALYAELNRRENIAQRWELHAKLCLQEQGRKIVYLRRVKSLFDDGKCDESTVVWAQNACKQATIKSDNAFLNAINAREYANSSELRESINTAETLREHETTQRILDATHPNPGLRDWQQTQNMLQWAHP